MGTQLTLPKEAHAPIFDPYLLWPNGYTKMPLGMEVGLGTGDFVLDGDPALPPPKKGHSPPIFDPSLLWPNGCMYRYWDIIWYGDRPQPRRQLPLP